MDNIGVFGTFGRKTLAIMLICIGDGIRDSLFKSKSFMEPVHVTEFPIRNQLDMKSTGIMTKRKLVNQ